MFPSINPCPLLLVLLALAIATSAAEEPRCGLHIENNQLRLDGRAYRGIGVNYVDAFMSQLGNPEDKTTEEAFKFLGQHAIPFLRTPFSGWGGAGMQLYLKDKEEYFRRMDRTVALAEKYRVGLICSLFWSGWVKDLTGESDLDAWNDPASKTHQMMATYIKEVVTRYRESRAIWGWEWGNELVLNCHLPNAKEFGIKPEDHYTFQVMRKVYTTFAGEVRKYDTCRVIDSGDTSLPENGWHRWKEGSWTKDTPEQFAEILSCNAPDPLNLMSIHAYGDDFTPQRMNVAVEVARKLHKPLYIGEFGVSGPRSKDGEAEFRKQLAIIKEQKVVLACLWEFDVKPIPRPEWLVSPTNDKLYMIEAIEAVNRAWTVEPVQPVLQKTL
ncbi:MAG: cellulase family glycosylhydrolase [Verrucomicrobiota bacterium]